MDLLQAINSRYSCRKYSNQPVSKENLTTILEAARRAPSACNSQRWVFVAVDDVEKKKAIASTMYHETWKINFFAQQVPAFIVAVEHPVRNPTPMQNDLLTSSDTNWQDIDMGTAIQNICLTATSLGLGNVIMGYFDRNAVRNTLGIPAEMKIPVIIGIGHPLNPEKSRQTPRLDSEEVIRFNQF